MRNEEAILANLYEAMFRAMIHRDLPVLDTLLADSFVLIHMTGMRQNKQAFLSAVKDGTLRYLSAQHDKITVCVKGMEATLTGQSSVRAAVFGSGEHPWRLRQDMKLTRDGTRWTITQSIASTY